VKQVLGSLALGVACFGFVAALVGVKAGEGAVWGAWLVTTACAAAHAGYCWPRHPLRSGLLIMLAQPPCLLTAVALAGEIRNPGSSTGGLVAVGICSTLLLFWAPVPLLIAWASALSRRRDDASEQGPQP
jgi:threonine/homoserine/homoserine lactone efflux protein